MPAPHGHGLQLGGLHDLIRARFVIDELANGLGDLQDFEDTGPTPVARMVAVVTAGAAVELLGR